MSILENAYALIVGIANYQKINPLPTTVLKDAQDIHNLLVSPNYGGYVPENVQLLLDSQATQANLREALSSIAQKSNADSSVVIYISSHGGQVDFGPHAGGIGQPKDADAPVLKGGLSDSYYERLKQGTGRAILASSRSTESSYIIPGADNSLFTQHLLAGLQGGIASEDGLIRIFDLFEYVQPRVTSEQPNQHPIFKAELEENFPIALYLGGQKGVITKVEAGFRYDAYISYVDAEPDTTWVWDTLLPQLEKEGLKVAVSGDVEEPGVARVVNIERGIRQAKRTIIVLSETYLSDNMAEFENTLGQTMGIQEGTYRLLPVKSMTLDSSRLPTRLSMLTTLDLSHPRRAEREFQRLVQSLKSPLPKMGQ